VFLGILIGACSATLATTNATQPGIKTFTPLPAKPGTPLADIDAGDLVMAETPASGNHNAARGTERVLWGDSLPPGLVQALGDAGFPVQQTGVVTQSALRIAPLASNDQRARSVARWLYLLVTPFPSLTDDVSWAELHAVWQGESQTVTTRDPWTVLPLYMNETTLQALRARWGDPAPGVVTVWPDQQAMLEAAWANRKWAVIPFENLEARWKVLRIDGKNGLEPDAKDFPLWVDYGWSPVENGDDTDLTLPQITNFRPEYLVSVILSGTTALVRGTALKMEEEGVDYPGERIKPLLERADVLHISNEVPFYDKCPSARPLRSEMRFCSDPRYLALLTGIGTDVVELTGNHLLDWGGEAFLQTLRLYREMGLPYYGGGENLAEALSPLRLEVRGTRLAFLGCNAAGPEVVWAGITTPGAAPCDLERLTQQIHALSADGYFPIVTFQHYEVDDFQPTSKARYDFKEAAQAGAVIISGSQAHFPQGFSFQGTSFIHYGLGNLFFDQMTYWNRRAFLDRHLFYQGRYLGTELITIILEDASQPRLMNEAERQEMLETLFAASDWQNVFREH
jgi:hypothetical protein